jgi:putative transposase
VPTIRFQVLYVSLVLAHDRRRVVHFNVTAHPTAEWTAQQLREAFPFDQVPRYLLRDRDRIFGHAFREQLQDIKIKEVLSGETSLRRILSCYFAYYHQTRPHLSLDKDAPEPRSIQGLETGSVVAIPQVGGLHHRYERRAA